MKSKVKNMFHLMKQEIFALKRADHPNIVRLYEVFEDDKYLHIVMDLCQGKDLLVYLVRNGAMPEK
jgi:calcium-dependent protein kinase